MEGERQWTYKSIDEANVKGIPMATWSDLDRCIHENIRKQDQSTQAIKYNSQLTTIPTRVSAYLLQGTDSHEYVFPSFSVLLECNSDDTSYPT